MATVNLNDKTLQKINASKDSLSKELQNNYNKQAGLADQKYNELINASKDYATKQSEIQNQQTNQAIKEINQNKAKAESDYLKEQKGAYADYAKQTNEYGVNAEKQASAGLAGSGYSESSRVNMYNTYQNRYVSARESYMLAVQNYDNQITQARLQNSSALAEIAYKALQTQLQTAIEGFQYKNELLNNLTAQKINVQSTYDSMWQSQYQNLLNEAQYNEDMAYQKQKDATANAQWKAEMDYQKQRDAVADSQWQKEFNLSQASVSRSSGGSRSSGSSRSSSSGSSNALTNSAKTYAVNTAYYQGDLNPDAKNGTFSNGYQPNNVGGQKLSKTKDTVTFNTETLSGQKQTVTQSIWKTKDGSRYYWEGRQNKYIKV